MTFHPKWLVKLFPAVWRARYGDELNSLLDDASTTPRDYLDLLAAALRLQLATWSLGRIAIISCSVGLLTMLTVAVSNLTAPTYYVSESEFILHPAISSSIPFGENFKRHLVTDGTLATLIRSGKLTGHPENSSVDERVASLASRLDIVFGSFTSTGPTPKDDFKASTLMIIVKDENPPVALSENRAITAAILAEGLAPSRLQLAMQPTLLPEPQAHLPWHELMVILGIFAFAVTVLLLGLFWLFLSVIRRRLRSA